MPWLRGGTVAVTNGSTTVVGTNADFAANSRVGDAFVGPDGLNYEISNVASATVISIIPAYKGVTASGVAYAIMPVQGYPKTLADAFNNINLQFGAKLAALGTTGNYDILPVSKGGTGGSDQAGARAGLGLGAAAVENIVPVAKGGTGGNTQAAARSSLGLGTASTSNVTTSSNSSIAGQVVKTLDYGLGLTHVTPITDMQSGGLSGSDQWFSTPQTAGPLPFPYGFLRTMTQANSNYYQIAYEVFTGGRIATRFFSAAAGWSAWTIQYGTSNTTRAADGTLKAI
jgi:hypothetical protein